MHPRRPTHSAHLPATWLVAAAAIVLLAVAALALASGATAAEPAAAGPAWQPRLREIPDDAPVPSGPRPGVPAATPRVGQILSVQVNLDRNQLNIPGDAANEPSIAVDPTNPNRMAIGWRQFDSVLSNFRQAGWAWSPDGGRTWRRGGVLEPGIFRSDPVLATGPNGEFYYSSLMGDLSCQLFVSTNAGISWLGPFNAYGGDKQWITVDHTQGIGRGFIYSAWSTAGSMTGTNTFTRSINGGYSFQTPTPIPSNPVWGSMDVGPDGAVYVAGRTAQGIGVARASTAQDAQYLTFFDFTRRVDLGGVVQAQIGGDSPNPDGLLGQVWVAVDKSSGTTAGNVYVLASVNPPGDDPLDVMFACSTDNGNTYSPPVRVNDVADGWQWNGTMSVAPSGRIDVVWNDTRDTGTVNLSSLYYSRSTDGGKTWSPGVRISPEWDSHIGWPDQFKIGDYYHMISDDVGANLAWAATFNGEQDVWFTRIGEFDCNGNGIGDLSDIATGHSLDENGNQIPDECEQPAGQLGAIATRYALHPNVPNPFNPVTRIPFDLPEGRSSVRIEILDVAGRLVRTLDGTFQPGRNAVTWDGRNGEGRPVASGVYVCRLVGPGIDTARRLVLAR